ncbi:uncharacterized protein NECHADRAFT_56140, partial [Fusarium vanettenii 77-13-4]
FIRYYHKARKIRPKSRNIIGGWKSSGLWPVSMAKSLMNPMASKLEERPVTPPEALTPSSEATESLFCTPRSSQ